MKQPPCSPIKRSHFRAALVAAWGYTLFVSQGQAQSAEPPEPAGSGDVIEVDASVSNFDDGALGLTYRHVWPSKLQLGAAVRASRSREAFFAGYAVDDATNYAGEAQLLVPLHEQGPLLMQFRAGVGARLSTTSDDTLLERGAPGDQVTALTTHVGLRGTLRLGDAGRAHLGMSLPVSYQVDPEGNLDQVGTVLEGGGALRLSGQWWLTANLEVGGLFGSDGDAGKALTQGTLGVRTLLDGADPDLADGGAPRKSRGVSPFVHTGWRVGGQGGHLNHGPAVEVGVLLTPHLKLGIASHTRPGPLNPKTFTVTPSDGQTYKGQSQLTLKSDGAFVGLLVAPSVDLTDQLELEVPVSVGQAAYGFYLFGDDRKTPDGRRVSKWEDELQDGKDSGFALGVDAGVRLAQRIQPWMRVVVGAHYTQLFGYDAYASDDYSGPSGSIGLELGGFE
ncbi:MAG: hypothetical protein R3B07_36625 [Polyangiaceae bacterium]